MATFQQTINNLNNEFKGYAVSVFFTNLAVYSDDDGHFGGRIDIWEMEETDTPSQTHIFEVFGKNYYLKNIDQAIEKLKTRLRAQKEG